MPANRRRLPWPLLMCSLLLLAACAANEMEGRPLDLSKSREGYLMEGLYHNDFYHFTWRAPQGWNPVKPTPLEALISRPEPDRGYMFGWANPAQQAEIRFLVFPPAQGGGGDCSPQKRAREAAQGQNWRLQSEQPGKWHGHPAVQVHYSAGGALGQPDQAVLARYVCVGQDLLVFQLQLPAMDYNSMHDLFQKLLRQVEFAGSQESQARPVKPAAAADLLHTVKYGSETLANIVHWYTGDANLAPRVQEYNQLPEPVRVRVGQQIKIPGELVTNRNPMPPPSRRKPTAKPAKKTDSAETAEPAEAPAEAPAAPSPLQLEPIGPK